MKQVCVSCSLRMAGLIRSRRRRGACICDCGAKVLKRSCRLTDRNCWRKTLLIAGCWKGWTGLCREWHLRINALQRRRDQRQGLALSGAWRGVVLAMGLVAFFSVSQTMAETALFKSSSLTPQGEYTFGIEGPAVDRG